MTILNKEKLTDKMISWCQQKAKEASASGATVGVSGGVDSAVVLALCAKAFPKNTTAVAMPCHSSKESLKRSAELVKVYDNVHVEYIKLESAFNSIVDQFSFPANFDEKFVYGGLRSCLRAPVLDFVAKATNSLVFGTGNRDEDEIFRYYQKRGDGAVDNNVLACLHKSEVWELAEHLGVPKSIIEAAPTADLWGEEEQTDEDELGLSYEEIEWAVREIDNNKSLTKVGISISDKNYTDRQKHILTEALKAERATRHKAEPPPVLPRKDLLELELVK